MVLGAFALTVRAEPEPYFYRRPPLQHLTRTRQVLDIVDQLMKKIGKSSAHPLSIAEQSQQVEVIAPYLQADEIESFVVKYRLAHSFLAPVMGLQATFGNALEMALAIASVEQIQEFTEAVREISDYWERSGAHEQSHMVFLRSFGFVRGRVFVQLSGDGSIASDLPSNREHPVRRLAEVKNWISRHQDLVAFFERNLDNGGWSDLPEQRWETLLRAADWVERYSASAIARFKRVYGEKVPQPSVEISAYIQQWTAARREAIRALNEDPGSCPL